MTWTLLQVALGGAIGAVGRYLTGLAALRLGAGGFPYGTLTVNVIGSLAMGVVFVALTARGADRLAPFLMAGVLGGFTTFSAFSLDTLALWQEGRLIAAMAYVAASVALSLGAVAAGVALGRGMFP
ncbi:fluoride efflux transporter CrcB [Rhodovulum sp. YNF3179]|uniref:fluoride efflux transporter CrcB n=1 Tax=Rhodovulum sp. YNF3179 TaxID=3425127 RepID=UPI003D33A157